MKKQILISAVSAMLLLWVFSAGCGAVITGSGRHVTKDFDFSGFTMLEISDGFKVRIMQSDYFSISIMVDENIREQLDVGVKEGTLKAGLKPGSYVTTVLKAEITMPVLEGIKLSDGSGADITGFSSEKDFSVTISDGGELAGDIVCRDIGFGLSDGSRVELTGSGRNLMARSSNGSDMVLENFPVNNADINIADGGSARLNISGRLDTTLTAGSEIIYTGDPEMGEVHLSAGSTLKKKQP